MCSCLCVLLRLCLCVFVCFVCGLLCDAVWFVLCVFVFVRVVVKWVCVCCLQFGVRGCMVCFF